MSGDLEELCAEVAVTAPEFLNWTLTDGDVPRLVPACGCAQPTSTTARRRSSNGTRRAAEEGVGRDVAHPSVVAWRAFGLRGAMRFWDDVQMDPASAQLAAGELRRAAERLGQLTQARTVRATDAADGWAGSARDSFDEELSRLQAQADDLVAALRRAATQIDQSLHDAHREQRRREQLRAEHRQQQSPQVR